MLKTNIFTRYIVKEYLQPLLLGIMIFTFVLLLDKIFDLVDLFVSRGIAFTTVCKLLIFIFPSILTLTIPMGFLLGSLLTFGRLSEDGEITAFRASGQHILRLMWPPLAGALLVSIMLMYFNSEIAPYSQNAFRNLYREVLKANPLFQLEKKTFLEIMNFKLYVHDKDDRTGLLKGVNIYRLEENAPPTRIRAQEGTVESTGTHIIFNLTNGTIQQMDPLEPSHTTISSFKKYHIQIPIIKKTTAIRKNIRSMKSSEILKEINYYRSHRIPITYLQTEFNLRIAISFAPLAFCLIGAVLGIKLEKGSKSIGFGLSLVIIFLYYLMLVGGITLSEKGYLISWLDLWLCNFVVFIIGGIFLLKILQK